MTVELPQVIVTKGELKGTESSLVTQEVAMPRSTMTRYFVWTEIGEEVEDTRRRNRLVEVFEGEFELIDYSYTSPSPIEFDGQIEWTLMSERIWAGEYDTTLDKHPHSLSQDEDLRSNKTLVHMRVQEAAEKTRRFREDMLTIYGFVDHLAIFGNRMFDLTVWILQMQFPEYEIMTHKSNTMTLFNSLVTNLFVGYKVEADLEHEAWKNRRTSHYTFSPKNIALALKSDEEIVQRTTESKIYMLTQKLNAYKAYVDLNGPFPDAESEDHRLRLSAMQNDLDQMLIRQESEIQAAAQAAADEVRASRIPAIIYVSNGA